jgi:hypothetical protein
VPDVGDQPCPEANHRMMHAIGKAQGVLGPRSGCFTLTSVRRIRKTATITSSTRSGPDTQKCADLFMSQRRNPISARTTHPSTALAHHPSVRYSPIVSRWPRRSRRPGHDCRGGCVWHKAALSDGTFHAEPLQSRPGCPERSSSGRARGGDRPQHSGGDGPRTAAWANFTVPEVMARDGNCVLWNGSTDAV